MNKKIKSKLLATLSCFMLLSSTFTFIRANEQLQEEDLEVVNNEGQELNENILVEYDIEGIITEETVEYGENLINTPDVLKEGYEFENWLDKEGEIFDINQKIFKSEYLTAKYKKVELAKKEVIKESTDSMDSSDKSTKITKIDTRFNELDYEIDKSNPSVLLIKQLNNKDLKDLYIPGKFNNQPVVLEKGFFETIKNIDSLILEEVENQKVLYNDNSLERAFYESTAKFLNLEGLDTSNITNMKATFMNTYMLKELDIANWDTSKVINMGQLFTFSSSLEKIDVTNWNTSNVTDMHEIFASMESLKIIDVSNWDTSKVTNMAKVFYRTYELENLDVSKWDTRSATVMEHMFSFTFKLNQLDISNWNTSNVTDIYGMFYQARSIKELDLSRWNTSRVTDMHSVFMSAFSITNLDVSNWDTSNVTDMSYLFAYISGLEQLDVSRWDTANVIRMDNMFRDDKSLSYLDLSNWNLNKLNNYNEIFWVDPFNSEQEVPLIIISKDDKLSADNYDYSKDNRVPYKNGPIKDATEDGLFSDGNRLNIYKQDKIVFDTVADASIDPATYNKFMEEEPKLDFHTFKEWKDQDNNVFVPKTSKTPLYRKDVYTAVYDINEYTVSYKVDGKEIGSETVSHAGKLDNVPTPTKEGYTLVKWVDAKGEDFDITKAITSNQTLEAVFKINEYTVNYDVDGVTTSEIVNHGGKLIKVPTPVKDGYRFIEWQDSTGKYFDVTKPITHEENLKAIFKERFSIMYLDEGKFTASFKVTDGELLYGIPVDRTKEGYIFLGWFSEDGIKADHSLIINREYTFHSVYKLNEYSISYNVDGKEIESETVSHGANLIKVPTPTKEGYTFVKWVDAKGKDFNIKQVITSNHTLEAVFEISEYTVSYNVDGKEIGSETVSHGANLVKVPTPTKEGYTFVKWVDAKGEDFDITQAITSNHTLEAVFEISEYTVSYNVDGKEIGSETVLHGGNLVKVPTPTKEGYTFVKWVDANGEEFDVNNDITQNESLVGEFEKAKDTNIKPENPKDKDNNVKPEVPKDQKDINSRPSATNKGGNKLVNTSIHDSSLGLIALLISYAVLLIILKKKKLNN